MKRDFENSNIKEDEEVYKVVTSCLDDLELSEEQYKWAMKMIDFAYAMGHTQARLEQKQLEIDYLRSKS